MYGSKKGQRVLEASRKLSNAELLVKCNNMYDAQYDESVVHGSQSREREYREGSMVSSNPYKLNECNSFRGTLTTDRLQVAGQTRLCFTRLQEVHKKANCGSVTKSSDKLNVKSSSDSELCDDNGAVKKPVAATAKPLLNGVSQKTTQFVHE
ncbi:unnamed protein product [Trichobilharzia regenti]|nr:unnamed protein product [Trichobilharzia regenti]